MAADSSSLVKDDTCPLDSDSNAEDNVDIPRVEDDDEPSDVTADCCEVCLVTQESPDAMQTSTLLYVTYQRS